MPGVIGPDDVRRIADAALGIGGADGVEVLFMHSWGGLTRFASSAIHQSTWSEDTDIRVRVVKDGRIGVASANGFTPAEARTAAESAQEIASVAAPDPLFPGLAPPAPIERTDRFDEPTASAAPELRADTIAEVIGRCDGLEAAGAYETTAMELAVANTEGQFVWAPWTQAALSAVVKSTDGGNGFAEVYAMDDASIDAVDVGDRAARKARESDAPRDLEPGAYTVVLEPAAVSTLVGFMAFIGFGGRALFEGRSCLTGKHGEHVAASTVTLYDDATSPQTIGSPFDFEGVPRRRVDLIRDGVFLDGVYDRRTAKQAGKEATGHALPAPNPEGPFPLNLFMNPGDATLEEMIAGTERGVLVTRFHYSNVVHEVESTITGMTRDGTFAIEDGEVAYPVKNLRFTQSVLEALSNTTAIGDRPELASEFFFSASRVPALRVEGFHFTGRSDH